MGKNRSMGRLMPEDFDLALIQPSGQEVLEALTQGTDAAWLILPQVPFVDAGKDGEADVVALHADFGAV